MQGAVSLMRCPPLPEQLSQRHRSPDAIVRLLVLHLWHASFASASTGAALHAVHAPPAKHTPPPSIGLRPHQLWET